MKTKHRYGTGSVVKMGNWYYARFFSRVQGKVIYRATKESDRAKAEAVLKRLIEQDHAQAGGFISPESPESIIQEAAHYYTFSEIWNAWALDNKPSDRSEEIYSSYWKHLEAFCKRNHVERIAAVSKDLAKSYQAYLSDTYASSTAASHLTVARFIWNWVIDQGKFGVTSNPFKGIKQKDVQVHSRSPFTDEQVKLILEKSTGDLHLLCLIGVNCGMRISDARLLKWSSICLDGNSPHIHYLPIKTSRHTNKEVICPIVSDELLSILKSKGSNDEYVFPQWAKAKKTTTVTTIFAKFLNSIGIKTESDPRNGEGGKKRVDYGFHSFRHTFVTNLRDKGVSNEIIASMSGHSSTTMTARYGTVTNSAKQDALKKVVQSDRKRELLEILSRLDEEQLERIVSSIQ